MDERSLSSAEEFAHALRRHAPRYGVNLSADDAARLLDYYKLVTTWNPRLHLVAPCAPGEFAVRHVLESLFALPHFTPAARVLDIGSGAGLPIIPCLIARPDLSATLFESSPKKGVFLREALRRGAVENQAHVVSARFEETVAREAEFVMCRALERFTEMLSEITAWSPPHSTLLLFGGEKLRARIESLAPTFTAHHIPGSDRRFLFVISRLSL
ncbi:MAG TPA: RsmG family class I SAM-dependent methyltransferase [Pyrinomonadaceae bacterium]|nr:RsmG family class I SAM-dependent methyltransferase [Pyrinomonadaceae bacterium]